MNSAGNVACRPSDIKTALERLRERFASKKFSFDGENMAVTASFGACGFQGKEPPEFSCWCIRRIRRSIARSVPAAQIKSIPLEFWSPNPGYPLIVVTAFEL